LALAVAQEKCGFVHYDLYPWNIIIQSYDTPQTATYQFGRYVFTVATKWVPIIIDYGRTHVITTMPNNHDHHDRHKSIHNGTIDPFKSSRFQDCFSLIVSSVNEMMNHVYKLYQPWTTEHRTQMNYLMYLVNFFSGTDFQPEPLKTSSDLFKFLSIHKKYNEMIYGNKCGLEQKNPVDLLFYLASEHYPYACSLQSSIRQIIYPTPAPVRSIQHPMFYYDVYSGNDPLERVKMVLTNIEEKCKQLSSTLLDELSATYAANVMLLTLSGTRSFLETQRLSNREEMIRRTDQVQESVTRWYESIQNFRPLNLSIHYPEHDMLCLAKYDAQTFSMPGRILTILQGNGKERDDRLLSFREMFMLCSFYQSPYRLSSSFFSSFNRILDVNPLVILNHNANLDTLKKVSRVIYESDQKQLNTMRDPPLKTLFVIDNILTMINDE
jgi:hypothetical protein